MRALLQDLWNDQRGFVVTAEVALLVTLGIGAAAGGLYSAATAVDEELRDVARAFRCLDQSYEVRGFRGCGACTAGSIYRQQPVEKSLRELDDRERAAEGNERREREHADDNRRGFDRREDPRRFDRPRQRRRFPRNLNR